MNSGSHNHQALGYIYLAKQLGCNAISAPQQLVTPAERMVVINENAEFVDGETDYYELSLFKDRALNQSYICSDGLSLAQFEIKP